MSYENQRLYGFFISGIYWLLVFVLYISWSAAGGS